MNGIIDGMVFDKGRLTHNYKRPNETPDIVHPINTGTLRFCESNAEDCAILRCLNTMIVTYGHFQMLCVWCTKIYIRKLKGA